MKPKKIVFISSTYKDLKEYRAKVWDLLQKYEIDIRGMEQFGARTGSPLSTCIAESEQSDIYIGLIGMRYGTIDQITGKSYTMLEYEAAYNKQKDILFFLIDEKEARIPPSFVDFNEKRSKLDSFKKLIRERHTAPNFVDEKDLITKVELSLNKLLAIKEKEKQTKFEDSFDFSRKIIKDFLLIPKSFSGRTVDIKVKIFEKPFPASKVVCNSFNLVYGNTIGVKIEVLEPKIETFTNYLFIEHDRIDKINIEKNSTYIIKVILKFTEEVISSFRARFIREEIIKYENATSSLVSGVLSNLMPKTEKIIYEPEGTIITIFYDVITDGA